jgi:hypothetical protein
LIQAVLEGMVLLSPERTDGKGGRTSGLVKTAKQNPNGQQMFIFIRNGMDRA